MKNTGRGAELSGFAPLSGFTGSYEWEGAWELFMHQQRQKAVATFRSCAGFRQRCAQLGISSFEQLPLFFLEEHLAAYKPGTIRLWAGLARQFLRFSEEIGYFSGSIRLARLPTTPAHPPITLTKTELQALFAFPFSERPGMVRDLFCFQAATGQRIGDVLAFRPGQVQAGVWRFRQGKTGKAVEVPLHLPLFDDMGAKVLERYGGMLPPYSASHLNRTLKEIGCMAGLTAPCLLPDGSTIPKWQGLHTHTARASFITISAGAGVPLSAVRQVTGHTDLAMLSRYLGTLPADELAGLFAQK